MHAYLCLTAQALLHAKVVLSPHIYGQSVANPGASSDSDYTAPYLWTRLTNSAGKLTMAGYTSSSCTSGCTPHIFPVAVGADHPPTAYHPILQVDSL